MWIKTPEIPKARITEISENILGEFIIVVMYFAYEKCLLLKPENIQMQLTSSSTSNCNYGRAETK